MRKLLPFIPFLVIIFSVFVFFYPFFLQERLPVPSDTITGLYYPFRDLYSKTNPNGLPYKNFLITDPVRQQYPWKSLAISLEKGMELPVWNPYEMGGVPLLGNFQSSVFYPLNILLFISPFYLSWSIFILLQPLLAGIFLYVYLKHLKLNSKAALLGAITWSFCGFSIAWMEWGTIVQTALWLPLILLSMDKLISKVSIRWILVLLVTEVFAIFAGHLQVLFYSFCIANLYLIIRIIQKSLSQKSGYKVLYAVRKLITFFIIGSIVFLITSVQIISTFQFILLSNRSQDQLWTQAGWFIPYQNLIQFIAPDFFGNPTTLNYFGVWNYAEFIGYIGIGSLILALFALLFRHDKKTWFFLGLMGASLFLSLPSSLSKLPFVLQVPFLSSAQPTRLLFVVDLSLAVLAALGFDILLKGVKKIWVPVLIIGIVFVLLWGAVLNGGIFQTADQVLTAKNNLMLPTLLYIIFASLFLCFEFRRNIPFKGNKNIVTNIFTILVFVFILFDLFRFGWKFTPFTNKEYLFPDTKVTNFLQKQQGVFRISSTDARILPPNFSVMYKLQSIEGYDPLYLKNYAEFIVASERQDHSTKPPFGFNRIITPRNLDSQGIDFLNVRYVLSLSDINSPKFKKVFQSGQTRVYENMQAFKRAYFVQRVISPKNGEDLGPLMYKNDLSKVAISNITKYNSSYSIGTADIAAYTPNKVVIKTNNNGVGILVLSDVFYPIFSATIDGKDASYDIFPVNIAFRGIQVPAGMHTVEFTANIF